MLGIRRPARQWHHDEQFRSCNGDRVLGIIQRLSQVFSAVLVVKSFIDGDEAFVLAFYDWTFPHAVNIQGWVAELWKAKDGKLQELTIFFDTGSFDRLAKG